jgi:dihydrolipoamide dehydrogenase
MLAHVALAEGECAARNAMGERRSMNYRAIPYCIFTMPEVAWVGLTEEEARKEHEVVVGRYSFAASGKARVLDETFGMVKVVSDALTGRILGIHMIGPQVTELIGEAVLAVDKGLTVGEIAEAIHPHPTLSEALMEAAMACRGGAIHMP